MCEYNLRKYPKLFNLCFLWFQLQIAKYGLIPATKTAMDHAQLNGGSPRLPVLPLNDADKKLVEGVFEEAHKKIERWLK